MSAEQAGPLTLYMSDAAWLRVVAGEEGIVR